MPSVPSRSLAWSRRCIGARRGALAFVLPLALVACASSAPPSASATAGAGAPASSIASALPPVTTEPTTSAVPIRTVTPLATIPVAGGVRALSAASDSIWVTGDGVTRVDPKTNTAGPKLPVNGEIGGYGFGSYWVPDFDGDVVIRIDSRTAKILARIPLASPEGVLATPEGVWVTMHRTGQLALIDPTTDTVRTKVAVASEGTSGPSALGLIDGLLWVVVPRDRTIVAVDPKTATVVKKVEGVPHPCGPLAQAAGSIWVSECMEGRNVDSVDTATGAKKETWVGGFVGVPIPRRDGIWLPLTQQVVVGPPDGLLLKLSGARLPIDEIDLGPTCTASQDVMPAIEAFGSVWIGCADGAILRLAPSDLP